MPEINNEYNQLCGKIGQARYQIHRIDADIRSFLKRIEEVEVEAAQRTAKDLEDKKKELPKPEEQPEEQLPVAAQAGE